MRQNEFEGLAAAYERFRPDYPDMLFERIQDNLYRYRPGIHENGLLCDVGSGTGISTRILRRYFPKLIPIAGIEPGLDMLEQAMGQTVSFDNICYIRGDAASLCFADGSIDLVLVAQAVQWFPRQEFYAETARVLKQDGIVAIIQNNRMWEQSQFLHEYEDLLEKYSEGYSRHYRSFDIREELSHVPGLQFIDYIYEDWERSLTHDEFFGMATSSTKYSKAQKKHGAEVVDRALNELLQKHFPNPDDVRVKYRSELFMAAKS